MFYNFVTFHSKKQAKKTKYSFMRMDSTSSKSTIAIIAYELIYFTVSLSQTAINFIKIWIDKLY